MHKIKIQIQFHETAWSHKYGRVWIPPEYPDEVNLSREKSDFQSYLTINSDGAGRDIENREDSEKNLVDKEAAKTRKTLSPNNQNTEYKNVALR